VKRNLIKIYLYCELCRKKGGDAVAVAACLDCRETPDKTLKYVLLELYDEACRI
jgi:hypothetical protein